MLKALIIFGTGVYAGVYIAQNYEIDKVEDPKTLFAKLQSFINEKMAESKAMTETHNKTDSKSKEGTKTREC